MFSRKVSWVLTGLECQKVEVEADMAGGLHNFNLVGLPDAVVKESRERIGSAIRNSGYKPPHHFGRLTVSLAPSTLPKKGGGLDLAMAIAILEATRQIKILAGRAAYAGELSLDGSLRKTVGILPMVFQAKEEGYRWIFVPRQNEAEARLVEGIEIIPLASLKDYGLFLTGEWQPGEGNRHQKSRDQEGKRAGAWIKLEDIYGQAKAKRVLMIAAAGWHNFILWGPPGTGKTLLVRTLGSILDQPSLAEQLEMTKIYSAAGLLKRELALVQERPIRSPHHSATEVAIIGGGQPVKPGEVTLAHGGVLFLDELGEFPRRVLENLRLPLEQGRVNLVRARQAVSFPACFILAGAMNPCPCGYQGDKQRECSCSAAEIARYRRKLSGPFLDRIDCLAEVSRVSPEEQTTDQPWSSDEAKQRIKEARDRQRRRFGIRGAPGNAWMSEAEVKKYCKLAGREKKFLAGAVTTFQLSMRAYYRILKTARTIADLEGREQISNRHLAEALQFRLKGIGGEE